MADEIGTTLDDDLMQQKLQEYAAKAVNPGPLYTDPTNKVEYVVNPETGMLEGKRAQDVDYTKDRVKGVTEPWYSDKYSGVLPEVQTGAEAVANALTLGGFDVVRSALSTPEQRRDILERKKQNTLGETVGEIAPYLTGLGELGAAADTIGFIPSLGARAAKALGPEASGLAKLTAEAAVSNATAALSAGVANSALNDYSKESIKATINETLLAGGIGALFGGGLGLLGKIPTREAGESVEVAAKSGFAKERAKLDSFSQTISNLQETGQLSEQAATNGMTYKTHLLDPFMNIIEKEPGVARPFNEMTLDQLKELDFIRSTISAAYDDPKIADAYMRTGTKNLNELVTNTRKAFDVSKRYNIFDSRPVKPVLQNIYEPVNAQLKDMATLRGQIEPTREAFDKALLNTEVPKDRALNLANRLSAGDDSFIKSSMRDLEKVFSPQDPEDAMLETTIKPEFARDLHKVIEGMAAKSKINDPKLVEATNAFTKLGEDIKDSRRFESFLAQKYPEIYKSGVQKSLSTPEQAWDFLVGVRKKIGDVFEKYSETASKDERTLVSGLYKQIDEMFPLLGKRAQDYAATTAVYSDLGRSEKVIRKVLKAPKESGDVIVGGKISKEAGVQSILRAEINPDAFDKLGAFTESSGKSMRTQENFNKGLENLFDVHEKSLQDLQKLTGKDLSGQLEQLAQRRAQALQANEDRQVITDYSLKRWYKMQKTIPKLAESSNWPEGAMSPRYRLTHLVHDVISGNTLAAGRQGINLAVDWMTSNLNKMKNPTSINDYYMGSFQALDQMQKISNGLQTKSSGVVQSLVKGISAGGAARVVANTLPYQASMFSRDGREQISSQFEKISKRLNEIQSDQSVMYNAMEGVKQLDTMSAGFSQEATQSMTNLLQGLAQNIPKNAPISQGGMPPPLIDQAKFLDTVVALTQPNRVLDLIQSGSVTSEQLNTFKQTYPTIYQGLLGKIGVELIKNKNMGLKERSRIQSMFPEVNSVLMPVPGATAASPIAPPPQNPGDQNSPTAMPKAKGVMKLDASKFNNFTQSGGTGV